MKHAKKLLAALLALAMMLAMAVPAFADDAVQKGTIQIDDAIPGSSYTAYKIFDLSYTPKDGDKAASYSYTVANGWADFVSGAGAQYVEIKGGNVVAKDGFESNTEAAAAFAKAALAYAEENLKGKGVSQTAPAAAEGSEHSSVRITNLDLGYYVVSTSAGSLCSLGTTSYTATIEEKNEAPVINKTVKDASGNYADSNSAKIGDTVEFKVTIEVKKGATNYVLNDTLSAGLTLNANSIQVVSTKNGDLTKDTAYTVDADVDAGTLKVEFKDSALVEGDTLTVTYNAVLNEKATTGKKDPNTNTAQLTYGNNNKTTSKTTNTYTYEFDIVKTDGDKNLLTDAQFKLYTAEDGKTPISFVKDGDIYRVAKTGEIGAVDTIVAGHVVIKGLAAGTYWLEETVAPFSYNKLTKRQSFTVVDDNNHATLTADGSKYDKGGMQVINQSGTTLPSTGGIGTTIFYLVGGGLMVAAAVLLITKKRMENKDN